MATVKSTIAYKDYRLDPAKVKLAQTLFEASTETETIERALDLAITELERNRIVAKAHREFIESGIEIRDVFGRLAE